MPASSLHTELSALLKGRADALAEAKAVKGSNDRVDALTLLCREVLRSSSLCFVDGEMHFFDGMCYVPCDGESVLAVLGNILVDMGVSPTDVRRMAEMPLSVVSERRYGRNPFQLCFTNGVVSVAGGAGGSDVPLLLGFDRGFVVTERMPYPYDRDAACPRWSAFLEEVIPDASVRTVLQEFFGMCYLDRERISVEKMALFVGKGANGKSVVFEVMKKVLGDDNVSTMDAAQLAKENMLPYVKGKRLNFSPDIRKSGEFDSALKALASGQDVTGRRIYGDAEKVKCPPICFALNEMPRFRDTTDAFFRRVLYFSFDVRIPPERQDRRLAARICAEELPGIFNWVIGGRNRLAARGGEFSPCPRMDAALERLRGEVNAASYPVRAFLNRRGYDVEPRYDGQQPDLISVGEIRLGIRGVSANSVSREMTRWGVQKVRSKETYYKVYKK